MRLDCPIGVCEGVGGSRRVDDRGFTRRDDMNEHLRKVHKMKVPKSRKNSLQSKVSKGEGDHMQLQMRPLEPSATEQDEDNVVKDSKHLQTQTTTDGLAAAAHKTSWKPDKSTDPDYETASTCSSGGDV